MAGGFTSHPLMYFFPYSLSHALSPRGGSFARSHPSPQLRTITATDSVTNGGGASPWWLGKVVFAVTSAEAVPDPKSRRPLVRRGGWDEGG